MNKKFILGSAIASGLLLGMTAFTTSVKAEMNNSNPTNTNIEEKDCSPNSAMQTQGNRSPVCTNNTDSERTRMDGNTGNTNDGVNNSGTRQDMYNAPVTDSPSAGSRNRMDDNYNNNPNMRNRNTPNNNINTDTDTQDNRSNFRRSTTGGGAVPSRDNTGKQL